MACGAFIFLRMIEPWTKDVWSGSRKNEVILDGKRLVGAGVSLRVLMHAFAGEQLVWFSAIYGMHADNCVAYAVEPETASAIPEDATDTVLPIETALRGAFELKEYPLTESAQSALGVNIVVHIEEPEDNIAWREESAPKYVHDAELHEDAIRNVRYRVYVHDDCFFRVEPVDDKLLRKLILCILEQHSFYLEQQVDWEPALDEIVGVISRAPAVAFKSDPGRKRLLLTLKTSGVKMTEALFGFRPRYVVEICQGTAHFRARPAKVRQRYTKAT